MTRARSPRSVVDAAPRGPEHLEALTCEACRSARVTRLTMTLTDGSPVDFTSCHTCEHKSWRAADGLLALDTVLTKATKLKIA